MPPGRKINYRPPETDSEDEYDGFYFGDQFVNKPMRNSHAWMSNTNQELLKAVLDGDETKLRQQVIDLNFGVDEPVDGGFTLLLHACKEGHLAIVRCLLVDFKANANKQVDSLTPLMLVCECKTKDAHIIAEIVDLLLQHGAVINVSDRYGTTPFMLACKNGHIAVVRRLLPDVSFDAVDNQGCTPIFHAIENNQPAVVKLLIDAGVNATIANKKGYTPVQVAQFHGFYDLLELLPKEKECYVVPSQFLGYNTLRDYIPRIFLKTECPEYFQEINSILLSLNMEKFLQYFAKERVSLIQFLSMNEEKLQEVGIEYPIYRMQIMKGLLDFHLHHWSKKSIARVSRSSKENFYEILMMTASHLQHLVIITASLRFIRGNINSGKLGHFSLEQLVAMKRNLNAYSATITDLQKTTEYLASFSPPKNPLHIDYDEFLAERKRFNLKCYFKYTTIVIGISVFICLKAKKFFFQ